MFANKKRILVAAVLSIALLPAHTATATVIFGRDGVLVYRQTFEVSVFADDTAYVLVQNLNVPLDFEWVGPKTTHFEIDHTLYYEDWIAFYCYSTNAGDYTGVFYYYFQKD